MKYLVLAAALALPVSASAATMTENFDNLADFYAGFLGTNSNLNNVYGNGSVDRGNNPDGLWLSDGDGFTYGDADVSILFTSAFGASITDISFLLSTFVSGVSLTFYDGLGAVLSNTAVVADSQYTPVLSYGATSANGISGFSLFTTGGQVEGNTSIDAVTVTTGTVSPVPLPASLALLGLGLGALGLTKRRRKAA